MYYRGSQHPAGKSATHQVVCYAESSDGINWTKPNLGLVEFDGSKENNIIWDGVGSHNFAPFNDSNPLASPDAAYKALGVGKGGLYAFKSADGVRWSLMSDKPVITKGAFDSQNLAFYDHQRKEYVEFHRDFRNGVRDIKTGTSKDFVQWADPEWIEYPGVNAQHLYTNQILPYQRAPHIYMGFPMRFVPGRRSPMEFPLPGVSDAVFMTSRDGKNFHRWSEAFIRPGLQLDRWVCRNNAIAWGIVETDSHIKDAPEELSLYAVESYYTGNSCRVRRYSIRQDGFASIQASFDGGKATTKEIMFKGSELVLNFSTSAIGAIRVEIQDANGKRIKGFAASDCIEIYGDSLSKPVAWKSGSDVSELAGRPIRLHFEVKDADIYSIQFR
ncbi:hypothetical protein [Thalassoroseus pseudoceratinae]|uniref:hypothetical protein n=1 Tax=Thalassoroseus pseudoceratinae TaxID=2713176 RepID=UPI001F10181A|nr:hypothetical protein [Thalassoroseus pseudoceratinae]